MNFFKEQKLYRVEIIKSCPLFRNFFDMLFLPKTYIPSPDSLKLGGVCNIPIGIKGWVIKKWGKLWFYPDDKQDGMDLFIPADCDRFLIPYDKIKNYFIEIKNVSDFI